ncbi:alpha-actinin-2 [Anaeramoeba ignava]|uniref:Alpha-actinin-2 n=1 Tax=Anaeramoeba ignava TaxID=1746090 RepID=A0A9Q0LV64_ANAIG|nr:alpha-actinin-2 [Anaeramoeba ignava]|eukprot:Anaeramoba_ignava/c21271_g1_i2.p1 GENE.c21271_g1_i2~~c21271_g1_i2.p1  ORF type:complete len:847 (+),score=289.80 c21271_g1_i2:34-2574(+)
MSQLKDKEWERVQKKTFTKWINTHLGKRGQKIESLETDFQDGLMLISLLEIIGDEKLTKYNKNPKIKIQKIQNVKVALDFIESRGVKLASIGPEDIVDGNVKLTLGTIWTIILRFQIADISVEQLTAKEALLLWCQRKTEGYRDVDIKNFTWSWQDGLGFNALIHRHRPDLLDYDSLKKENKGDNLNQAFQIAEKELGIAQLLDAEDMIDIKPDERSVMVYLSEYFKVFSKGQKAEVAGRRIGKLVDLTQQNDALKENYIAKASDLKEWIEKKIEDLSDNTFDNTYEGIEKAKEDFKTYKTEEKPPRTAEKVELESLMNNIKIKLASNNRPDYLPPEGLSVEELNKLWDDLTQAELARIDAMNKEFARQKMLRKLLALFDKKVASLEQWAGEKEEYLQQEEQIDNVSIAQLKLKMLDLYHNEYETSQDRLQECLDIGQKIIDLDYIEKDRVANKMNELKSRWGNMEELEQAKKQQLQEQLELHQRMEDLRFDYASRCKKLRAWIDYVEDFLTEPLFAEDPEEVRTVLKDTQKYESEIENQQSELDDLASIAQQLSDFGITDFLGYTIDTMRSRWNSLLSLLEKKKQEFQKELEIQIENEKLCRNFATKAQALSDYLEEKKHLALAEVSGNLKEELPLTRKLSRELMDQQPRLDELKQLQADIDSRNIHTNKFTTLTVSDLTVLFEQVVDAIQKKAAFIEQEMLVKEGSKVSPTQLNDFKKMFDLFDRDKKGSLYNYEFSAVLNSLGDDLSEQELKAVFDKYDADGNGTIEFDEFVQFMTERHEDADTREQSLESWRVIAAGKDYVTQNDMQAAGMQTKTIEYLVNNMPQKDSGFDYVAWVEEVYNR